MPEAKQPDDSVRVAIHDQTALLRVDGRGTFKVSAALKQFGQASIIAGCTNAVLDMSACVGMDSTFMGVLAGWAARLKEEKGGRLIMANLAPRTRGLVATLGLDLVVEAYQAGEAPEPVKPLLQWTSDMAALEVQPASQIKTAETMLEAHENLVRLSPSNAPRFKDVLTFLREDLQKRTQGGQGPT